jgi:hypothetical protein
MAGLWIALAFFAWYLLALIISEQYHKKSGISKQWLFFISFMFSPLAGIIVALLRKAGSKNSFI